MQRFKFKLINFLRVLSICGLFFLNIKNNCALVFLDGTSSSGKSSICKIVSNQEQWAVVASLYWDWAQADLTQLFPYELTLIQSALPKDNIIHALRRNIIFFKKDITQTQQQKDATSKAIEKIRAVLSNQADSTLYDLHMKRFRDYSLGTLKTCLENNEHVLFDGSWYADLESLHISCKKYSVLAYCSFQEMIKRIAKRRQEAVESGNSINHRFFCEGMRAFVNKYWITPEKEGAIDTIYLDEIKEALQIVESLLEPSQSSEKRKFIVQEFTREEFNKFKEDLLAIFVDCEKLYIVPKNKYDLVLRTDKLDSHECAKKILELAQSKFS